jgi:hypothetical protein
MTYFDLTTPKSTIGLIVAGWLLSMPFAFAQDTTAARTSNSFATFFVSGGLSEFSRESSLSMERFDRAGLRTWRAGLTIGMVNTRFYQMRLELGYTARGAQELFVARNNVINSKVRLNYAQATLLPVVFKFGWKKFGAFAGAGGYAAYLVSHATRYTVGDKQVQFSGFKTDTPSEYDYGISVGGGIYLKNHLLEIRLENGMVPVFASTSEYAVRNRSLNIILHL